MCERVNNVLKLMTLAAVFGLAGCATTIDLNELAAKVSKAQATADDAVNRANAADKKAADADQRATDAGNKASAAEAMAINAKKAADEAMALCKQTEEKCNRMFQKSMQK